VHLLGHGIKGFVDEVDLLLRSNSFMILAGLVAAKKSVYTLRVVSSMHSRCDSYPCTSGLDTVVPRRIMNSWIYMMESKSLAKFNPLSYTLAQHLCGGSTFSSYHPRSVEKGGSFISEHLQKNEQQGYRYVTRQPPK
jgi:hypothetical protein